MTLSNEATQPQVSSGHGCTRGLRISSFTVTAAFAKAASVAALSPASQVKMWFGWVRLPCPTSSLPAMSSRIVTASGAIDGCGSTIAGSSSYSTSTASTPSAAA